MDIAPQMLPFLVLGAFAGGFINGLAGTGTALFAMGFYLVVLPPTTAVAIVALMSVLAGLQGLWTVRQEIRAQPFAFLWFAIPGLIGVPIGLSLISVLDAGTMRIAIAVFLIVYGGYFGFRTALPAFSRKTPFADALIGFTGGALGGAAGVSGALPSMWLSLRPWPKSKTRAILQPFNMCTLIATVCLLFVKGAYDQTALRALAITVPVGLIAAQVGLFVFKQLGDDGFRRVLILLVLLMGLGILISELI